MEKAFGGPDKMLSPVPRLYFSPILDEIKSSQRKSCTVEMSLILSLQQQLCDAEKDVQRSNLKCLQLEKECRESMGGLAELNEQLGGQVERADKLEEKLKWETEKSKLLNDKLRKLELENETLMEEKKGASTMTTKRGMMLVMIMHFLLMIGLAMLYPYKRKIEGSQFN